MLSLLLAFLVTTPPSAQRDPQTDSILLVCDTPPASLSLPCGLYVRGFTDAMLAHEHVEHRSCLPASVDLNAIRLELVREFKGSESTQPAKVRVWNVVSKLYPCPH